MQKEYPQNASHIYIYIYPTVSYHYRKSSNNIAQWPTNNHKKTGLVVINMGKTGLEFHLQTPVKIHSILDYLQAGWRQHFLSTQTNSMLTSVLHNARKGKLNELYTLIIPVCPLQFVKVHTWFLGWQQVPESTYSHLSIAIMTSRCGFIQVGCH